MFDFRMRLAVWVDLKVPQRGVVGVWVERVSNGLPLDAPTAPTAAAVACCTAIVVRVAVVVMRK